jgi:hypothetical protein
MSFWSPTELAAHDYVEFTVPDSKGKPINFTSPIGAYCKVVGGPRPAEWQVTGGPGLSGATRKLVRVGLAEGTITLRFTGDKAAEQRKAFREGMWKYFRIPAPNENPTVATVKHPRFAAYPTTPVTQVQCLEGPPGDWDEMTQVETVVYKWGEWRKPAPTLSSANTAGNSKDGTKSKNAAKAALDASVTQNSTEIGQLSAELATL